MAWYQDRPRLAGVETVILVHETSKLEIADLFTYTDLFLQVVISATVALTELSLEVLPRILQTCR